MKRTEAIAIVDKLIEDRNGTIRSHVKAQIAGRSILTSAAAQAAREVEALTTLLPSLKTTLKQRKKA